MTDPVMQFDESASRRLLKTYMTKDVVAQRRLVRAAIAPTPGERMLDLGSGPGLLAHELAAAVGSAGRIDGIDVSESMLAIAREQPGAQGAAPVRFTAGGALSIPFPDESFDAVIATQVYEYVADIPAALAEARRVLAPGGRIVILDTDWDSMVWHSSDPARMVRVLSTWDEHLVDPHLPRRLPTELAAAGLGQVITQVIPMLNVGYGADSFSGGLLEMIAGYVGGRQGVTPTEAQAWAEDLRGLGDEYFFSLNRYLFTARR
jgi:arsenite methyltransferase